MNTIISPIKVKQGTTISVYEFRNNSYQNAVTISIPYYNEDSEAYEVVIKYENGDTHYAVWYEEDNRWVSGDL